MDCLRFSVDEQHYALELHCIRKVLPSVWVSFLHDCPPPVAGVINYQGHVIPVIDLRKRLNLPEKNVSLSDRFIWFVTAGWDLILIADQVHGVETLPATSLVDRSKLPSVPSFVKGVVALPDGLLLIQNPAALLELREHEVLRDALARTGS
ncbi:MAG TPA: CheW domain-containing protein [Dongiaceae bacterium]|nr:CheW domain-containing protein [Dongiaceae bacterium]